MERKEIEALIEKQKSIIEADNVQLQNLQSTLFKEYEEMEIIRKYFNTYWMYKDNCYSCPNNEEDYWNVYYFIYAVDNSRVKGISFQQDSNGKIIIENIDEYAEYFSESHIQITKKEFNSAWENTLIKIKDYAATFFK
jgi:hypothetical protein